MKNTPKSKHPERAPTLKTAGKKASLKKKSARAKTGFREVERPTTTTLLEKETRQVTSNASALYHAADKLHLRADDLHQAVRETRKASRALYGPAAARQAETVVVVSDDQFGSGKPFPIVGIGASAGGYEAIADFLMHLPADTGMAYVLIQHLDPKHKSQLTQLLSHSSKIPVVQAIDGVEAEPDRLYVIPENSNLALSERGRLRLLPRKEHELPPMPIDLFFRSLAKHQQNRAVAVVFSGTGSDGTLGIEAVKGEGGITFAQDERTSKYFGMPGSAIASGSVDFIMSPGDIAKELGRIARHPFIGRAAKGTTAPAETSVLDKMLHERPDEIGTIFTLLRGRTGVDFSLYKQSTLKRRIVRRMVLHKKEALKHYVDMVQKNAVELDALFNDLLINVTGFFRDPKTFQVLKKKVFPRLIKSHTDDSPLRLWVCGCSTGEEAYSLAMSLVEYFDQTRTHLPVQIFATDIGDGAIEKARVGIYPENIQQDISPERLRRFFMKVNGNYQVHKSIRDMCVFARQNVLMDPPFSNLDLVSCRNVLIYFGPVLQRKIIPLFHYAPRPTGFLLLGNSETIGASTEHFTLLDKKHKIYARKPTYLRPGFELAAKLPEVEINETRPGTTGALTREQKPMDLQLAVDNVLMREFSPATVVVNTQLDVVHFRGRTGLFLEHAPGGASLNVFKMVRDGLSMSVRAALSKAMRQDVSVKHTGIEFRHNSHQYEVSIEVVPFRLEPLQERLFAVVFREAEVQAPSGRGEKPSEGKDSGLRRELAKAKLELVANKESMQSIIEEQEATNEELKSANEEIQSSNEELQSTNEELETAKEELQSTNEELTTLNEELQTRNTELSQVNNDLVNLLGSVNIPILMVGQDLTIRRFTPMAERLFNLIPSDTGRRVNDLSRSIAVPDLDKLVKTVVDELRTVERELQDRDGRWHLLRIRPYRTRENKIDGAVILLIDVDELRRALDTVLGMVRQPLLMLGEDLKIRNANDAFLRNFHVNAEDVTGRLIFDVANHQWDMPQFRSFLEDVLPRNKCVNNFTVEAHLPKVGLRKLRLNASRFFDEGQGIPLILLAIEDMTGVR